MWVGGEVLDISDGVSEDNTSKHFVLVENKVC